MDSHATRPGLQPSFPLCAICKKPVDRLESHEDKRADAIIIVAICHGAHEDVSIPVSQYIRADKVRFDGTAFGTPKEGL